MSEAEVVSTEIEPVKTEVFVPGTGEVVSLADVGACARAIQGVRLLKGQLDAAMRDLTEAIVQHSEREGTKTIYAEGVKVTVNGGTSKSYDAQAIERELREAGMSEERIREIVTETVTYSVAAGEAKRAAQANPKYAAIIERNTTEFEKTKYVSVSGGA